MTKSKIISRFPPMKDTDEVRTRIGPIPVGTPLAIWATGLTDELTTTSKALKDLDPYPILGFHTDTQVDAYILFTAECRVSKAGERLKVIVDVNDSLVGTPGEVVLTASPLYESRSTVALRSIPPGNHLFAPRWCVSAGTGYLRNQVVMVWLVSQ